MVRWRSWSTRAEVSGQLDLEHVADPRVRCAQSLDTRRNEDARQGERWMDSPSGEGFHARGIVGLASAVSGTWMDRSPGPSRRSAIRRCPPRRSARSSAPTIQWSSADTWNSTGRGWRTALPISGSCSRSLSHCLRRGHTRPGGVPQPTRVPDRRLHVVVRPDALRVLRAHESIVSSCTNRWRQAGLTVKISVYRIQYMRSIDEERPPEEITGRARIRDAALEQFALHGFEGATIRGIAEAAGVSPGLVQHTFRSQGGLRRACDEAVLDLVRRKLAGTRDGKISNPTFIAALYSSAPALVRYIARAVADGSTAGAELFAGMAAATEEFLSGNWPDRFPAGSTRMRDAATALVAQTA